MQNTLEVVEKLLATLTEKEAAVLDALYGLKGQEPVIVYQVAEDLELSAERVKQIWAKTMAKLTFPSRVEITNELLKLDPSIFARVVIDFP